MEYNINDTDYYKQIKDLENEISEYKKAISKRDNNIKILKLLEDKNINLLRHTFDDDCTSCVLNKQIHSEIGYLEEIEKIKKEINTFSNKTDVLRSEEIISKIRDIIKNENKITLLNSKIELVTKKIQIEAQNIKQQKLNDIAEIKNNKIMKDIEECENEIKINKKEYADITAYLKLGDEYGNMREDYETNNDLLEKISYYCIELLRIDELNKEKTELNKKNEVLKKKLYDKQIELNNLTLEDKKQEKLKKELDTQFKKMNVIDKTINLFKDGFREYILKNKAILLEKKINNTLLNLANYEIKIDTSDNNISFFKIIKHVKTIEVKKPKSKIKIIEDNEDVEEENETKLLNVRELCGFERVSFNIALRVALNSMNVVNKNNFLIIDEGFSASDDKNINNITYLFEIIKKEYELCLIISHLTEIKNLNERKIEITRDVKTSDSKIYIE